MRNRAFSLCVAATFYASATLSAPPPKEPFTEQLSRYPQEKLYVHTDKEHYIAGDTVWLRDHCVDAAGDYTLFMRNLPEDYPLPQAPARGRPARRRKIPARGAPARVLRRILLPRRGLSGQRILLPCGLQGVGRRRTPALLGRGLLDDKGHFIDSLRTRHAGIGSVEFPPRAGRRYMAEFPDRKGRLHRFELPDAKDYTFVLRVDPTDSTFIVSIRSGRNWLPRGLRLVVHRCGTQCYNKAWDPLVPTLTFRREELPEGLFQVLLLDEATGKALSERLVFNPGDDLRLPRAGTTAQGDARHRRADSRRTSRKRRLLDRRHRPFGHTAPHGGGHLLHAGAVVRTAGRDRGAGLLLQRAARRRRAGARRTAAHAGVAPLRRPEAPARRVRGAARSAGGGAGDRRACRPRERRTLPEAHRQLLRAAADPSLGIRHADPHTPRRNLLPERIRLPRQHHLRAEGRTERVRGRQPAHRGHTRFVPHVLPAAQTTDLRPEVCRSRPRIHRLAGIR